MKALIKSKSQRGLWLEEIPRPTIGINNVLIRMDRAGICGTDLHIYQWDAWAQKTIPVPKVIGHEFVGDIVFRYRYRNHGVDWAGSSTLDHKDCRRKAAQL